MLWETIRCKRPPCCKKRMLANRSLWSRVRRFDEIYIYKHLDHLDVESAPPSESTQNLSFCTHLDISKMANMYRWSLHLHSKNCDCADRRTVTLKQLMFWRNGKPTSIGTQPSKNCDTLVGTVHPKDSLSVALQLWKPSDVGRTWAQRSITMNRAEVHDEFHFMSKKMEKCHTVYEQLNNWYILKATSHSYRLWQKSNPPTIQGLFFISCFIRSSCFTYFLCLCAVTCLTNCALTKETQQDSLIVLNQPHLHLLGKSFSMGFVPKKPGFQCRNNQEVRKSCFVERPTDVPDVERPSRCRLEKPSIVCAPSQHFLLMSRSLGSRMIVVLIDILIYIIVTMMYNSKRIKRIQIQTKVYKRTCHQAQWQSLKKQKK